VVLVVLVLAVPAAAVPPAVVSAVSMAVMVSAALPRCPGYGG
jgi:hypothetical protein